MIALELERLRTRNVLFFLDSVGQHVDHLPELRGLAIDRDVAEIGSEFGIVVDEISFASAGQGWGHG